MAASRSTARRRRSRTMARQASYARATAPLPVDADGLDTAGEETGGMKAGATNVGATNAGGRDSGGGNAMWDARPRWPAVAGLVICVLGLADAAYLTYAHYTTAANLACSTKGFIDCAAVTTSRYSHILGFPVSVLGLIFFAALVPLMLPVAWRSPSRLIRLGRLAATAVGMGMVLWLVYVELVELDAICEYCTAVHILTFALFVVVVLGTIATAPDQD